MLMGVGARGDASLTRLDEGADCCDGCVCCACLCLDSAELLLKLFFIKRITELPDECRRSEGGCHGGRRDGELARSARAER